LSVYLIDPLQDDRWEEFLERRHGSSIFHSRRWLKALKRTYGFEPVVLSTSSANQELENGLVFCRVKSRLRGRRLVSVPFSDHCEPLLSTAEEFAELKDYLVRWRDKGEYGYIEIRPVRPLDLETTAPFVKANEFVVHRLNLNLPIDEIFDGFHKDSIQRKIRRAERERLHCEEGRSDTLLQKFYELLIKTRRRQQSLPQPLDWFRNLVDTLGDSLQIRVASKGNIPLASIFTIRYKESLVYKYGCSDSRYNNLGGTHLLFWKAIQEANSAGLQELDLGRSDIGASGLITFKDRWGAAQQILTYWSYPGANANFFTGFQPLLKPLFKLAPDRLLQLAGTLLYRHAA
jgi:CelD/BcsL family acetyltransferase involved in cellulose biosynthesis